MFLDSLKENELHITIDYVETDLLEPILTIALDGGPMKTMPSSASRSANFAFSLKKPYLTRMSARNTRTLIIVTHPGWTACS
jgi:hypothetical protein